jgi:hypothetical protein
MPEAVGYSARDESVASQIAAQILSGDEPPLMRLAVRVSAVAVDRWGLELEKGEPKHPNFDAVLEDTTADTLRYFSDEDAHVDGVNELVFEGRPISSSELFDAATEVTDIIEAESGFDRNSPGGLIKEVGHVE